MKGCLVILMVGFSIGISSSGFCKDLGVTGEIFPVKEKNMLDFIKDRVVEMQASGAWDEIMKSSQERVRRHALRPVPVAGLTQATNYRVTHFDPTFVVGQTITDHLGNVIARKGDKINPLEKLPVAFDRTLFFIDGDNKKQIQWTKKTLDKYKNVKIILVNGNVREASEAVNHRVYFDQNGVLVKRFGLQRVPVVISPEVKTLKVEEFAVD